MMPYVQLFADLEEPLGLLSDAERGRLVLAMLQYNRTGESGQLTGTEKVIWPMIRERLDRSALAYEQRKQAGVHGGRPKGSKNKPKSPLEPEKLSEIPAAQVAPPVMGNEEFITEDEAQRIAQGHQEVYDAAQKTGLVSNARQLAKLEKLLGEYPTEWILKAIDEADDHNANTFAYITKILQAWKAADGPTEGRKPEPKAGGDEDWSAMNFF